MFFNKMNKKNTLRTIFTILFIILIAMQVNTSNSFRVQQSRIDSLFKESIDELISSLTLDFNKMTLEIRYIGM